MKPMAQETNVWGLIAGMFRACLELGLTGVAFRPRLTGMLPLGQRATDAKGSLIIFRTLDTWHSIVERYCDSINLLLAKVP